MSYWKTVLRLLVRVMLCVGSATTAVSPAAAESGSTVRVAVAGLLGAVSFLIALATAYLRTAQVATATEREIL